MGEGGNDRRRWAGLRCALPGKVSWDMPWFVRWDNGSVRPKRATAIPKADLPELDDKESGDVRGVAICLEGHPVRGVVRSPDQAPRGRVPREDQINETRGARGKRVNKKAFRSARFVLAGVGLAIERLRFPWGVGRRTGRYCFAPKMGIRSAESVEVSRPPPLSLQGPVSNGRGGVPQRILTSSNCEFKTVEQRLPTASSFRRWRGPRPSGIGGASRSAQFDRWLFSSSVLIDAGGFFSFF